MQNPRLYLLNNGQRASLLFHSCIHTSREKSSTNHKFSAVAKSTVSIGRPNAESSLFLWPITLKRQTFDACKRKVQQVTLISSFLHCCKTNNDQIKKPKLKRNLYKITSFFGRELVRM